MTNDPLRASKRRQTSTKRKKVHPKVASAGLAGSFTVIIVFVAGLLHVEITQAVAAALATVAAYAAGYLR